MRTFIGASTVLFACVTGVVSAYECPDGTVVSGYECPIPAQFTTCITSRPYWTCTLASLPQGYVYGVYSPIRVLAEGVTIQGASTQPTLQTLQRKSAAVQAWLEPYAMMGVEAPNVTIRDIALDGNRWNLNDNCGVDNLPILKLISSGTTVLDGVYVMYSRGSGVWAEQSVNMYSSLVIYSHQTGVHFKAPNNVAYNNVINLSGTAGLTVWGGNTTVAYNQLTMNRYEMPDGVGGGQLTIWQGANSVNAHDNTIDGMSWYTTPGQSVNGCPEPQERQYSAGIEVDTAYNVTLTNNEVKRHAGQGIAVQLGSGGVLISSSYSYIENNVNPFGLANNGIFVNSGVYGVTFGHINSSNNTGYGILYSSEYPFTATDDACLVGNTLGPYSVNGFPATYPRATSVCP